MIDTSNRRRSEIKRGIPSSIRTSSATRRTPLKLFRVSSKDACAAYAISYSFTDPLYPETVILAALGAGGHHSRHADNCRQNEQGDWVANHTPQRDVTAIYYLNDEFDGGEIVFERVPLVVKPRRGLLLAFPSDAVHLHEVLAVRSGVRYTMPIWFTKQQRYALADFPLVTPTIASTA